MAGKSLLEEFDPREQELWGFAERADADGAQQAYDAHKDTPATPDAALRARLLLALACQNAGKHDRAIKLFVPEPTNADPDLLVWMHAERTYAEIKPGVSRPVTGFSPADADRLESSGSALKRFIAARARLALGVADTKANNYPAALEHLERALGLMKASGSALGVAAVEDGCGLYWGWRGDPTKADAYASAAREARTKINPALAAANAGSLHDSGYAMHRSGHAETAAIAFRNALASQVARPERTKNGLATALIDLGEFDEAREISNQVLAAAQENTDAARKNDLAFRETIARKNLGVIALRSRPGTPDMAEAESQLAAAVKLVDPELKLTRDTPIYPEWVGPLASKADSDPNAPQSFEKLELVLLELLIHAERHPGEAGRRLDKLADIYAMRTEALEEIKVRREAAGAFRRAKQPELAALQLEQALRIASARGASSSQGDSGIAAGFLAKLQSELAAVRGGGAREGAPSAEGEEARRDFAVISLERRPNDRWVRRHRFMVAGAEEEARARAGLAELRAVHEKARVLRGLPAVIELKEVPFEGRKGKTGGIGFDIVVDCVSGPTLAVAMKKRPKKKDDILRAVGIFRNLAAAVGTLHAMGITDVRPDPALVRLILPEEPVYLDILPLHPGEPREPEADVRLLVNQLARWLCGGGPTTRSFALERVRRNPANPAAGFVFPVRIRSSTFSRARGRLLPLGLDEFLTRATRDRRELAGWKPSTLADRLQEFC